MTTPLTRKEKSLVEALMTRNGRRRSGCCRCEGVRAVRELLDNFPELVEFTVATERGLAALPGAMPENLRLLPEREFEAIAGTVNSQGVMAIARSPDSASGAVQGEFLLVLDQLGDPGNFGTIARTLLAVGGREMWYTKGSIDPWGDKAIRAGMGAQFALRLRRFETLDELTAAAVKAGFANIFVTDPHGGESCFECGELFDKSLIIIGGEPNGVMGDCGTARHVTIPMPGDYESINAAQAATVILFESVRRRCSGVNKR